MYAIEAALEPLDRRLRDEDCHRLSSLLGEEKFASSLGKGRSLKSADKVLSYLLTEPGPGSPAVNIALVNELKMLFMRMGIDVWEVIDAAATKPFGFMPFYPGPGLGGHCIPVDPYYLSWQAREYDFATRFIELAGEVNTAMPYHVVDSVASALNERQKSLKGSRVMVLGVAYKKDVDDMRESPSLKIIEQLTLRGAKVDYNDPHFPEIHKLRHYNFEGMKSVPIDSKSLAAYDCVLIATDHTSYDYPMIVESSQLVVDTRNATRRIARNRNKIVLV